MHVPEVGINDLAFYIPRYKIDVETIREVRSAIDGNGLDKHLKRAISYTEQESIRFPHIWEDAATLAAQAAYNLFQQMNITSPSTLRHISVGTETTIDHAKPIAAHVQGMLRMAGFEIPRNLSTSQVQHACAGGTIAMLNVASQLKASSRSEDSGLAICTDIAKYQSYTTSEITQGSGSVAIWLSKNPKLINLNIGDVGYSSQDVDDFFRPLGSETAKVKGRFSIQCYLDAFESAFDDYCARTNESADSVLNESDLFVLHVPYKKLPEDALINLIQKKLNLSETESIKYLNKKGFYKGLEASPKVGNLYTGSMYLALANLLKDRYDTLGNDIIGRRILFASYGSGNTMIIFSGTIAEGAANVIQNWTLSNVFDFDSTEFSTYDRWMTLDYQDRESFVPSLANEQEHISQNHFHLSEIRKDGYREYQFRGVTQDSQS